MPASRSRQLLTAAVIVTTSGLGLAACGDHSDSSSPSARTTPSASAAPLVVRTVKVSGRLSADRRDRLRKAAGKVVDQWWQRAYLSTSGDPFGGSFTTGAAKLAARDVSLMSNRKDGDVGSPVARRREVGVDIFAVKGRAVGVTAALHLTYDTTGSPARRCTVGGTVSLRPQGSRWRIFGYDVTHTCGPQQARHSSKRKSPKKPATKRAATSKHTSAKHTKKHTSEKHASKRGAKK